ncbi:hypothetical protein [Pseudomonas aeruginosa]|uniref:hypothetical protein n=1 Tax=Pseudomonas aeruginosa TaxID=287 RepID=UPI0015BC57F0|nr:hypothetical protein [Pseudomonas aeruginosa]EKW5974343.1 hypothetical protein [Pseudomonas aeruginosa]EMB5660454.1 hypothetical protein [Pseudomonas aeruginosa]MBX6202723.1 hypothetical protein [Pseudomonas aeruginosa]MBX6760760.1 hypothetical protein [Pseudomonas aeruginosa]MCT5895761.1 hypothetical protein [Pseudomonas aeruginosa]
MSISSPPHPPRSPRDYAVAILAEPSRERRKALLEACPAQWRDLVREHVEDAFAKVKAYRQMMDARADSVRRGPPPAPGVTDTDFRLSNYTKSAPEVGNAHLAAIRAALGPENPHA